MNEALVRSLKQNPVKYAHLVGLDLLGEIHNEWIKMMAFGKQDETLLGHRGSYKTTCLSFAIALIMLLMPDKNIIFTRKTDDDVVEVIRQVGKILQSDTFQYMARELYGVSMNVTPSAFRIDTSLHETVHGTPQLLGLGIKASLTGKHADIVFTDDIVNIRDRTSRAEREQIKLQYMELQNIKNRDGRIFNTGTPWHKDDAISMMPNVHRYDCYMTGLIPKEKLKELRSSMSDSLFAANYELKHIADSEAMFTDPQFTEEPSLIYGGFSHVDAAYGGADYTAFTIMHRLEDGRVIAFGKLWHKHIDDCLDDIIRYQEQYRAGSIACELNADKGYLAKELKNRGLHLYTYTEHMNKYIKISSFLRKAWGSIYWLEATDPEYINQMLDYTEFAEHDDAPDSAASLLRRMERKGTFYSIKGGL